MAGILPGLLLVSGPAAAQQEEPDVPEQDRSASSRPYMPELDYSIPSQSLFADWPDEQLRQRPYWLPWSYATFQRASLFRRPLLMVLTVSWSRAAQKMHSEVLSDPQILESLNRDYLTIRVNADRRPDLRERYQTGTWPVLHFLLPNSHPMLSRLNEPEERRPISASSVDVEGMQFLLDEGIKYWNKYDRKLMAVGASWSAGEGATAPVAGELVPSTSDDFARSLLGSADRRHGGFGIAPKYIRPGLMDYGVARALRGERDLLSHGLKTISNLASSPLFDSQEGGLHRLATLPNWDGIQYEKMLQGNTAFLRESTVALQIQEDPELRQALQATCLYLVDQLSHGEGGFFLAQIADPSGEDGGDYWRASRRDPIKRPPVDYQVHAGSTALAGAALIRAGILLNDEKIVQRGRQALDHVLERAYHPGRGLDHMIFPSPSRRTFLSAQADGSLALVDAYSLTGDDRYLEAAEDIVQFSLSNLTTKDRAALLDRLPERQALGLLANSRRPFASNLRFARTLQALAELTGESTYRESSQAILAEFAGNLPAYGTFGLESGLVLERWLEPAPVLVLRGTDGDGLDALRRVAVAGPLPGLVVSRGDEAGPVLAEVTWGGSTRRYSDPAALTRYLLDRTAALRGEGATP